MKKAVSPADITAATRYLILVFDEHVVSYPADARSISNPGHGYPAYDERIPTCTIYPAADDEELTDLLRVFQFENKPRPRIVVQLARIVPISTRIVIEPEPDTTKGHAQP